MSILLVLRFVFCLHPLLMAQFFPASIYGKDGTFNVDSIRVAKILVSRKKEKVLVFAVY